MFSRIFRSLYQSILPSSVRSRIQNFILNNSGAKAIIAKLEKQVGQLEKQVGQLEKQVSQVLNHRPNRIHAFVQEALTIAATDLNAVTLYSHDVPDSELGRSFDKYGSDKNKRHSYSKFYEELLGNIESPRILEVGLGSLGKFPYAGLRPGGSLQAWRERYSSATIVGGDIDPDAVESVTEIAFVVDQTDTDSLDRFVSQASNYGLFDLIVDDGFHDPHANLLTALKLLPLLAPEGSYVIEDVHSSLIDFWRVILASADINGTAIDMSALRPKTDDNVLVLIKRS